MKIKKLAAAALATLLGASLLAGCGAAGSKKEYRILDETLKDEHYVIGFKKGNETLRDEVQRILVELQKDGTLSAISKEWFGEDKSIVPTTFTPSGATDDSLQKVKDKGVFTLGLDDSFPPMGFRDDESNIVGFDVDLAKEVASRLGMEIELKPIDWTANVMELNSGSVDCLWNGLSITPEREAEIDFSRPYLANRQVIIVLAGSDIVDIPSLAGKTVGLQDGSSAVSALEKNEIASQVTQQKYADNVTALTDLSIGRVDAVLLDEVVARYYETQNPGVYTVLDDSFAEEEYGIGFKKGNDELREAVQKVFDEMIEDGTAAEISEKWFGKDIVVKP